jgi:hypothetical protein
MEELMNFFIKGIFLLREKSAGFPKDGHYKSTLGTSKLPRKKRGIIKLLVLNIFMLSLFQVGIPADFPIIIREIKKPSQLLVSGDQLFISEGACVYRYNLFNKNSSIPPEFRLEKKFGTQGEGPHEFKLNPFRPYLHIYFQNIDQETYLLINSVGRVSFFNLNGEFIKEKKVHPYSIFTPVGNQYVGTAVILDKEQAKLSINLFDSNFEQGKEIYSTRQTISTNLHANLVLETIDLPYESFAYQVEGNMIYFPHEKEGSLLIKSFDSRGKEGESIEIHYEREKITSDYKREMLEWFKNRSAFKHFFEKIKKNIHFKSHFPIVKNMLMDNGCIYIFTYKKNESGNECLVLKLDKNKKHFDRKRIFLKLPEEEPFAPTCYTIKNKYFYSLNEDEDNETWELHREALQ